MELLHTILAAVVALGLLVTIHEYGHFWVARRCGVRVLRFSVGFGKPLWRRRGRDGTEYVIAAIPLGGYVRMLDEREGPVPPQQRHEAFNTKPVWQRIAIVAAGPLVNLIFAVFAYWLMFLSGIQTVAPVVGEVRPGSPAAMAGLERGEEILFVDGHRTESWEAVSLRIAARIGEPGELVLRTRSIEGGVATERRLPLAGWQFDEEKGVLEGLGLSIWRPELPAVIGRVVEGGAAEAAGIRPGDRILAVDGEPLADWPALVDLVRRSPERPLLLRVERAGTELDIEAVPRLRRNDAGEAEGYLGVGVAPVEWPPELLRTIQYGPLEAVPVALARSGQMIGLTLESIGKMVRGLISVENLSGPITIAKVAGASAQSGLEAFLNFLAYLSISLGVLNLLPIPVLDGGHLLYYLIEAVRGRPVSERTQVMGLKVGMAILLTLMAIALFNDVARL